MDGVLAQLGERYELIVIDTAPMGVVSDAFPLLRKVDGAIAVTRIGMCTRDTAAHLREQLSRLEAPVLGIVANAVKLGRRGRCACAVRPIYARVGRRFVVLAVAPKKKDLDRAVAETRTRLSRHR